MELSKIPYFDNNATTPVDKRVADVLNEYHIKYYANPSSTAHPLGMICNALFKEHHHKISNILNVSEEDIIFTSGATESINTAIKGIYFQYISTRNHIISCKTEHSAVLQTLKYLEEQHGARITWLNVDEHGTIDLDELEKNIENKTLMICLMAANNETGVLHPIDEIYQIAQKNKVLFFCDTTQLFGKSEKYTDNISADIFCGSAHKFYGPKGIGFLVIKNLNRKIFLHPLIHGGQQQTIRSGTLPLPLIAGLSKALEIIYSNPYNVFDIKNKRDYFENQLKQIIPNIKIHGEKKLRIVNTSSILFPKEHGEQLVKLMKKFCYSHGSACSDGSGKYSHVLKAIGLSDEEIKYSFRFSFSWFNTKEEADSFLKVVKS